ncbi:hypothetical protein BD769DRAFT_384454 [Suillus cothurnatus]|nr:hypothetical protein BD769DRAFT_384454 [Suillus cothurnatus]
MSEISAFTIQFIGSTISFVQLGVVAAQSFCYYRAFPRDKPLFKYLVVTVLILNITGTLLTSFMYWSFFSNCFRSTSPRCQACFYCHHVWIISGKNIYVTIPIILFAASSYVLGLLSIPPQHVGAFSNVGILKVSVARALETVLCDSMISLSIYFYLRSGRSGVRRTDTRIQSITRNFTSMGCLVCLLAASICILYWTNSSVAIAGVATVLRSSYANSLLSILNARKPPDRLPMEIELPTISVHIST